MIWCLGMYASGSTWLYNAARQTAAIAAPQLNIAALYANTLQQLAPVHNRSRRYIVKTHQLDEAATTLMDTGTAVILLTIRDPRDAVVSLTEHMGLDFFTALSWVEQSANLAARFITDTRTHVLRFEAGFIDQPETFDMLAGVFNATLTASSRDELFAGSRREAVEAKIANLERLPTAFFDRRSGDVVDMDTQWHRHHANRTGEIGRWQRLLDPEALRFVEDRLGGWMDTHGYARSETTR